MISPLWLFLLLVASSSFAVDRSKFRTCEQTSFCRRNRQKRGNKYDYHVDHVVFHPPEASRNEKLQEDEKPATWSWRQLLGSNAEPKEDDTYRGLPPTVTGKLVNTFSPSGHRKEVLQWSIIPLEGGTVRLRITEATPRVTYDDLVLHHEDLQVASYVRWWTPEDDSDGWLKQLVNDSTDVSNYRALQFRDSEGGASSLLLVQMEPFQITLVRSDDPKTPVVVLNGQSLMHFEVRRNKDGASASRDDAKVGEEKDQVKADKEIVGYWEDGLAIYADGTREEQKDYHEEEEQAEKERQLMSEDEEESQGLWEENFHEHKDTKPNGPMSVGMDVHFPHSQHLYGIPEHASSAVLQTTVGPDAHYQEPYRLYNLDVFEYELDETMALYGHVPLVVSQSVRTGTSGVFWFNPSETFVDVIESKKDDGIMTHWISESGVLDIFLLSGPTPSSFYRQYARLTGTAPVPPMFSLGYHQCRWNYKDEKDVYYVHGKFEELDYPYDVLWLDIEHTDGKRYFTWDKNLFPEPKTMIEKLASQGRKMVTIVDPHIKRDDKYYIHKEATAKGLYVKDNSGTKDYDGWCWPGSSSYLDFTDASVRSWWADQFAYDRYEGSTPTLFTWNDMNEVSVFNGPEVTMQKDLLNLAGHEQREWHNLIGMLFHRATGEGLVRRNPGEDLRPFVLSRSFFAGSQKYGAIWTGDNTAEWSHLEIAAPMLLSMNAAALSFVGADVGGFFGNPDAELFTRWMQAGAYTPFFRGHAHHDSKRREPWMFGEETLDRLRRATMARYALLPYWYTTFFVAETTGMPVMRMMWMQYPKTEALFGTDDQYLIGADLLVKPVTVAGATEAEVIFPMDDIWYDIESMTLASSTLQPHGVVSVIVPADIDTIPVYQRGGSIIPRKLRLRRSSQMMKHDPYTLYVALDAYSKATGSLYMDDEESFGYERRAEYALATFSVEAGVISNAASVGAGWESESPENHMVERIILMGMRKPIKHMSVDGRPVEFSVKDEVVVVRRPQVSALRNWTITAS